MSEISKEALAAACEEKVKQLEFSVKQSAFDSVRQELETELAIARIALLALRERAEPVEPIWRAAKYPVSRPVPGAKLIVWDEAGKFIGYGSAVDTRESGVAIQMCDGRRLDSNHDLRWQYALQPAPPAPVVPVETFEEWSRRCEIQLTLCRPEFREVAEITWNACRAAMLAAPGKDG